MTRDIKEGIVLENFPLCMVSTLNCLIGRAKQAPILTSTIETNIPDMRGHNYIDRLPRTLMQCLNASWSLPFNIHCSLQQ